MANQRLRRRIERRRINNLSIVAISDIRSQPLEHLVNYVRSHSAPDLIIYAGDDVARFRENGRNYFEELASQTRYGVAAVIGNDDTPNARRHISGDRVFEVHSEPIQLGNFLVVGVDGAPRRKDIPSMGLTLHSEAKIFQRLRESVARHDGPVIIVSHAPPFGVLDHAMRFGDSHIGSKALRHFIESDTRVRLVVCGHCHLQGGRECTLGEATIINVASHDGPNDPIRIAELTWDLATKERKGEITVNLDEIRAWGDLEKISGLWHTDFPKLRDAGITKVEQLAAVSVEQLATIVGRKPNSVRQFPLLAKARISKAPQPLGPLSAPRAPRVFFDIETDPTGGNKFCWQIGLLDESSGELEQYLAERPTDEPKILKHFANFCKSLGSRVLVSYSGSGFDHRNVIIGMNRHGISAPPVLANAVDLLYPIQKAVALPCRGYRLGDVAECLGFSFRHGDLDGLEVARTYVKHSHEGTPIPRRLLEYNEDDVRALYHVVMRVESLVGCAPLGSSKPKRLSRAGDLLTKQ